MVSDEINRMEDKNVITTQFAIRQYFFPDKYINDSIIQMWVFSEFKIFCMYKLHLMYKILKFMFL